MWLYPINLNIAGKPCAVIGGGKVAERKISTLIKSGALVTVFAPKLTATLEGMLQGRLFKFVGTNYHEGQLCGFFLVICATDNSEVNVAAAKEAKREGALVNVVDNPELCDFAVPAQVARGDLVLTISTQGKSPELARRIKEELQQLYGEEYGLFLEFVALLREQLKDILPQSKQREQFWQSQLQQEVLTLLRLGRFLEAEERIKNAISRLRTES